jgi:hypothetical protein
MRYADTPTFLHLNDRAVICDFNQWLKAEFLSELDPAGLHLLVHAFPHGIRPGVRRTDWPTHYRTAWYAQMRNGDNQALALDVERAEFEELSVVEGAPDKFVGQRADGLFELPALVVFDNGQVIDGATVTSALQQRAEEGRDDPDPRALLVPTFSDFELAEFRALVQEAG